MLVKGGEMTSIEVLYDVHKRLFGERLPKLVVASLHQVAVLKTYANVVQPKKRYRELYFYNTVEQRILQVI